MKEFISKNKVVLAIVAIILVGALLVGVIVLGNRATNNDNTKPTGDSQGTTQGTEETSAPTNPTDTTKPSDGTEPSDGTNPTEGTEPSQGTEPTDPSQGTEPPVTNPTVTESKPTEPPVTEPKPTEPAPTNPPVTEPQPTQPKPTEPPVAEPPVTEPPVVTQPSTYPTEPEDTTPDSYKGVTPDNLAQSDLTSWDWNDWSQFQMMYWSSMTPQQTYDYLNMESNGGVYYSCGVEGHRCINAAEHNERTNFICSYCGQKECKGWFIRDDLLQGYNEQLCDEYSVYKDPFVYCQRCGKHSYSVEFSLTETCNWQINDGNCYFCGEWVQGHTCHYCKKENIKSEFQNMVW